MMCPQMEMSTDGVGSTMQTRKRVLINAFTVRALRDTFSPARGAGNYELDLFFNFVYFYKYLLVFFPLFVENSFALSCLCFVMLYCANPAPPPVLQKEKEQEKKIFRLQFNSSVNVDGF